MPRQSKLDRSDELTRLVIEEYEGGATLHQLACVYKVGWEALRRVLIEHGIPIRPNPPPIRTSSKEPRPATLGSDEIDRLRQQIGWQESWRTAPLD